MSSRDCSKCGRRNRAKSNFCIKCGTRLAPPPEPQHQKQTPADAPAEPVKAATRVKVPRITTTTTAAAPATTTTTTPMTGKPSNSASPSSSSTPSSSTASSSPTTPSQPGTSAWISSRRTPERVDPAQQLTSPRAGLQRLTSPRAGDQRITSPRGRDQQLTSPRAGVQRLTSPRTREHGVTSPRSRERQPQQATVSPRASKQGAGGCSPSKQHGSGAGKATGPRASAAKSRASVSPLGTASPGTRRHVRRTAALGTATSVVFPLRLRLEDGTTHLSLMPRRYTVDQVKTSLWRRVPELKGMRQREWALADAESGAQFNVEFQRFLNVYPHELEEGREALCILVNKSTTNDHHRGNRSAIGRSLNVSAMSNLQLAPKKRHTARPLVASYDVAHSSDYVTKLQLRSRPQVTTTTSKTNASKRKGPTEGGTASKTGVNRAPKQGQHSVPASESPSAAAATASSTPVTTGVASDGNHSRARATHVSSSSTSSSLPSASTSLQPSGQQRVVVDPRKAALTNAALDAGQAPVPGVSRARTQAMWRLSELPDDDDLSQLMDEIATDLSRQRVELESDDRYLEAKARKDAKAAQMALDRANRGAPTGPQETGDVAVVPLKYITELEKDRPSLKPVVTRDKSEPVLDTSVTLRPSPYKSVLTEVKDKQWTLSTPSKVTDRSLPRIPMGVRLRRSERPALLREIRSASIRKTQSKSASVAGRDGAVAEASAAAVQHGSDGSRDNVVDVEPSNARSSPTKRQQGVADGKPIAHDDEAVTDATLGVPTTGETNAHASMSHSISSESDNSDDSAESPPALEDGSAWDDKRRSGFQARSRSTSGAPPVKPTPAEPLDAAREAAPHFAVKAKTQGDIDEARQAEEDEDSGLPWWDVWAKRASVNVSRDRSGSVFEEYEEDVMSGEEGEEEEDEHEDNATDPASAAVARASSEPKRFRASIRRSMAGMSRFEKDLVRMLSSPLSPPLHRRSEGASSPQSKGGQSTATGTADGPRMGKGRGNDGDDNDDDEALVDQEWSLMQEDPMLLLRSDHLNTQLMAGNRVARAMTVAVTPMLGGGSSAGRKATPRARSVIVPKLNLSTALATTQLVADTATASSAAAPVVGTKAAPNATPRAVGRPEPVHTLPPMGHVLGPSGRRMSFLVPAVRRHVEPESEAGSNGASGTQSNGSRHGAMRVFAGASDGQDDDVAVVPTLPRAMMALEGSGSARALSQVMLTAPGWYVMERPALLSDEEQFDPYDELNMCLVNPALDVMVYAATVGDSVPQCFVGDDEVLGPFVLVVCGSRATNDFRANLFSKAGVSHVPTARTTVSLRTRIKLLRRYLVERHGLAVGAKFQRVRDADFGRQLRKLERDLHQFSYKFGILYAKEGQSDEDAMFGNEHGSPAFTSFLQMLGTVITLKDWPHYRGGLDVRHGSTGTQSVYTRFEWTPPDSEDPRGSAPPMLRRDGTPTSWDPAKRSASDPSCTSPSGGASGAVFPAVDADKLGVHDLMATRVFEVMFHVSTMLPFYPKDPQQLERKRHLGNDIAVLVFVDGTSTTLAANVIRSEFIHVVIGVRPTTPDPKDGCARYCVGVACKEDVPPFTPVLPEPAVFRHGPDFARFLVTMLVNAERAAYQAPTFATKMERTRQAQLKMLLRSHLS